MTDLIASASPTVPYGGDPLDAMVCVREGAFPGCDEKRPDEKVLCVPRLDPHWNTSESLDDPPRQLLDAAAAFPVLRHEPQQQET